MKCMKNSTKKAGGKKKFANIFVILKIVVDLLKLKN